MDLMEEKKLHADLLAEYGEAIVNQATELSGLTTCLMALGADDLSKAERERVYHLAAGHVQGLVASVLPTSVIEKLTECAAKIDNAVEMKMLDDIEARDGLPPLKR